MYALIWTRAACAINRVFPLKFTKFIIVWHKTTFMKHPRILLEQYYSPLYLKKCKSLSFECLLNIFAVYGHVILMCFSRLLYKIQRYFCNTINLEQAFRVQSLSHQRNFVSLSLSVLQRFSWQQLRWAIVSVAMTTWI